MYFPYWRWAVYKGRKSAILVNISYIFLISNFRRVLNVVCFVPGNSPTSEFLYKYNLSVKNITIYITYNKNSVKNNP